MKLSDSSLMLDPETSQALGFGFRCGLGLLHMDVIQERLEREFDLDLNCNGTISYLSLLFDRSGSEVPDNPVMMLELQVLITLKNLC